MPKLITNLIAVTGVIMCHSSGIFNSILRSKKSMKETDENGNASII